VLPGSKDGKGGQQAIGGRDRPKEAAPDQECYRASDDRDRHQHDGQLQAAAGDLQPVVAVALVVASVFLIVGALGQLLHPVFAWLRPHPVCVGVGVGDTLGHRWA